MAEIREDEIKDFRQNEIKDSSSLLDVDVDDDEDDDVDTIGDVSQVRPRHFNSHSHPQHQQYAFVPPSAFNATLNSTHKLIPSHYSTHHAHHFDRNNIHIESLNCHSAIAHEYEHSSGNFSSLLPVFPTDILVDIPADDFDYHAAHPSDKSYAVPRTPPPTPHPTITTTVTNNSHHPRFARFHSEISDESLHGHHLAGESSVSSNIQFPAGHRICSRDRKTYKRRLRLKTFWSQSCCFLVTNLYFYSFAF